MRRLSWLSILTLAALVGCGSSGPELASVEGVVTDKGEPVANMNVIFTPRHDAAASWGVTDAEGKFSLTYLDGRAGVIPGQHRVSVTAGNSLAGSGQSEKAPRRITRPREYRLDMEIAADQKFVEIDLSAKK